MMKIYFFIILTFSFLQTRAQIIDLSISHNPTQDPVNYVVDFLKIDSLLISSVDFHRTDIKYTRIKGSTIIIKTKLLIVFDGKLLKKQEEKKEELSIIDKTTIKSLVRIDKPKALDLYGKKGKNGALIIYLKTD